MALTITHATLTGAAANPNYLVDGPKWDANHTITGSIAASEITSPAALTKTDDTNVTITLGGTPTTALLKATSITVGWTGTLAVSRGGTGAATHTAHGVLLGQGTSAITTLNGTVGNSSLPLISQGENLDPVYAQIGFTAISGWGTGVTTALAVNVGSAGAFVTFNGALGTPSSGVATNLTGTASGLTAGTFTAGSASNLTSGTLPAARTNGHMNGTATNDAASAGEVGELIGSTVTSGSAVSLTTATNANVTSISLTAGDWDVFGAITYNYDGTTNVTTQLSSISSTSATLDNTQGNYFVWRFGSGGLVPQAEMGGFTIGPVRKSLSSTTTIYLVARSDFTVSTASAYGRLWARRVR
ncbi:hypothetical protein V1292_005128 [Bradyrhizobium sp. AZCC 1719]|uniref:hypothetical protein n=1 Tax=Bradyrhizobium sp. AZCC 1719 TaxID=3117028 RepID=UPI002FF19A8D